MKLALIQMESELGNAPVNRSRAEAAIRQAAASGADIAVLPETWNLGFFPKEHLQNLAEPDGGESRALLHMLACELNIHIVGGSLITKKIGGIYNTAYVFDRSGALVAEYDKIHSFSPSGEHHFFQQGHNLCTFVLDKVKMGLVICYDLRFGELIRLLALEGIELLFVPAQWPGVRLEHWQVLSRARAIENQIFVASVNGCGEAWGTLSGGHSMLISPYGELLAGAGGGATTVIGEVDFGQIAAIRERINVFRDRRPELYGIIAGEHGLR